MKKKTKVIHYGNEYSNREIYLLCELPSGLTIQIRWKNQELSPSQKWWNKSKPEWIYLEDLFHRQDQIKGK